MGNIDSVPIVSQTKSLVQVVGGDTKRARETQYNFIRGCPLVSQLVSAGQFVVLRDREAAELTQIYFLKGVLNFTDTIPVVGHIKGIVHYAMRDREKGDQSMKSASRTVGVIGSGVGGFIIGGPIGAAGGGVIGGALMDALTTGIESAIHRECRLNGSFALAKRVLRKHPKPGDVFDLTMIPIFDGAAGYVSGRLTGVYMDMVRPKPSTIAPGIIVVAATAAEASVENPSSLSTFDITVSSFVDPIVSTFLLLESHELHAIADFLHRRLIYRRATNSVRLGLVSSPSCGNVHIVSIRGTNGIEYLRNLFNIRRDNDTEKLIAALNLRLCEDNYLRANGGWHCWIISDGNGGYGIYGIVANNDDSNDEKCLLDDANVLEYDGLYHPLPNTSSANLLQYFPTV